MLSAPWTEVGRLQQEVQSIRNELYRKVENHEIHSINSRLDSLEHSLRELGTTLDRIQSWMQTNEARVIVLEEKAGDS